MNDDQKLESEAIDYFLVVFYATVFAMLVIGAVVAHHQVSRGVGI